MWINKLHLFKMGYDAQEATDLINRLVKLNVPYKMKSARQHRKNRWGRDCEAILSLRHFELSVLLLFCDEMMARAKKPKRWEVFKMNLLLFKINS